MIGESCTGPAPRPPVCAKKRPGADEATRYHLKLCFDYLATSNELLVIRRHPRAPIVRNLRNRTAGDAIRIDDLEVSASKSAAANRIEPDIPSSNSKLALMALSSVRQIVFRTNPLQYCVKIVSKRVALTFLLSFWSGAWQVYSLGNFDAVHLGL